jgi:hypothetical protein
MASNNVRTALNAAVNPELNSSIQWAEGEDEQVEVNQRALIDKVLARYAAEFTGMSYDSAMPHPY